MSETYHCTVITGHIVPKPVEYRLTERPRSDWWGRLWGKTALYVESDYGSFGPLSRASAREFMALDCFT